MSGAKRCAEAGCGRAVAMFPISYGTKSFEVPGQRCAECQAVVDELKRMGVTAPKAERAEATEVAGGPPVRPPDLPCPRAGCGGAIGYKLIEEFRNPFWVPLGQACPACSAQDVEEARAEEYRGRLVNSGLPRRFQGFRFDRFVAQGKTESAESVVARVRGLEVPHLAITRYNANTAKALRDWKPGQPSVFLTGPVGGGKTTLLAAAMNGLMLRGTDVCYLPEASLYDAERVKMKAAKGTRLFDLAGFASRVAVLAIDDLGTVEDLCAWQRNLFERIIAVRYDANLPVFVSSNFKLSEVAEVHSERAASRLAEMCRREYELVGFDWRTGHQHAAPVPKVIAVGAPARAEPPKAVVRDYKAAASGERDDE